VTLTNWRLYWRLSSIPSRDRIVNLVDQTDTNDIVVYKDHSGKIQQRSEYSNDAVYEYEYLSTTIEFCIVGLGSLWMLSQDRKCYII
jgi:hypothetical protein